MVKLENIEFIRQIENGCCPASINIVLDYYNKGIQLDHKSIFSRLKEQGGSFFKSAKNVFENDSVYNEDYSFKVIDTESKEDWIQNVKNHIDRDIPVIISTYSYKKNGDDNYHITVIYGYDEEEELLYEMCPTNKSQTIKFDVKLKNYKIGGTDLLIITEK